MTAPHTLAADHVAARTAVLLRQVLPPGGGPPTSAGAQALAVLRRARPDDLTASSQTWAITLADAPAGLLADGGEPTPGEAAVHAALVLFARHQQGRGRPMHVPGRGLGRAARDLAYAVGGEGPAESMLTRFHAIGQAGTRAQRLHHLGTFVTLLRTHEIPLDYSRLADDLVRLDDIRSARTVRLTWSRDLHRIPGRNDTPDSPTDTTADIPETSTEVTSQNGVSA